MKNFLLLSVLLLCFSCKEGSVPFEDYYFAEAQPINDSELSEFPNRFIGVYQSNDSTFLKIQKKIILSESYTVFNISKTAFDTLQNEFNFSGKKLTSKTGNESFDVVAKGDSLQLSMAEIDTIFMFSENQKAKKINGNLVLNTKDSLYWTARWLTLIEEELTMNLIFSNDDLKRVDSLLATKVTTLDSSKYLIRPSRREFAKILKLKNFGAAQKFKKIKTNR